MTARRYIHACLAWLVLISVAVQLLTVISSWLVNVLFPESGVQSLLAQEGIRWLVGQLPGILSADFLLSLLYLSLAFGLTHRSGLLLSIRKRRNTETASEIKLSDNIADSNLLPDDIKQSYAYSRRIAFQITLLTATVSIALLLFLIIGPETVLLSSTGTFSGSSLSVGFVPLVSSVVMFIAVVYGACVARFRTLLSVFDAMIYGVCQFAPLLVAYVFIAQCYYSVMYVLGYVVP